MVSFIVFFFDDLGDVVVILDLRPDESLFEAGIAREVSCRIFEQTLIVDEHQFLLH